MVTADATEREYRWLPGRSMAVPAEVVADTLRQIRDEHGVVEPAVFIERSRPEDSPTHDCFDWDADRNAEAFLLVQARRIVSSFKVIYHEHAKVAPAFVSVRMRTKDGVKNGYVETIDAMQDPELRKQVIARALTQLQAWQRRYKRLDELGGIMAALEREMPAVDSEA